MNRFTNKINLPISEERKKQIQEAFDLQDQDKDKQIDFYEFKCALRSLGFDVTNEEAIIILAEHNHYAKCNLTHKQFLNIMMHKFQQSDPDHEMRCIFRFFDDDNKGVIDIDKLRRASQLVGEKLDDDQLEEMIANFDLDGDGQINETDFLTFMVQENKPTYD